MRPKFRVSHRNQPKVATPYGGKDGTVPAGENRREKLESMSWPLFHADRLVAENFRPPSVAMAGWVTLEAEALGYQDSPRNVRRRRLPTRRLIGLQCPEWQEDVEKEAEICSGEDPG